MILLLAAAQAVTPQQPLHRSSAAPALYFNCSFDRSHVRLQDDGKRLTLAWQSSRRQIVYLIADKGKVRALYRAHSIGLRGAGAQIRFTLGNYSYGISSKFVAGSDGIERVAFFVLYKNRLINWRCCQNQEWLSEQNALDRLPQDPLFVSEMGVETGGVPGVKPLKQLSR